MFAYTIINPSSDVVASLACNSYSKSVRLGGFKSVKNDYLNGDVTPQIFLKFSEVRGEHKQVHFSPYKFFFIISIYTHGA